MRNKNKKQNRPSPDRSPPTLAIAQKYVDAGLSVFPVIPDGTKRPAGPWKQFQTECPSRTDLAGWYSPNRGDALGIAIIAGEVSGGLEVIDFDTYELYEEWVDIIRNQKPGLLQKLVLVQTPRPGMHVYYRCKQIGRSQKLAQRRTGTDHRSDKPVIETLIETRGEGGYVLAPGSPPSCHPSGRQYQLKGSRQLTEICKLKPGVRDYLIGTARTLNEWTPPPPVRNKNRQKHRTQRRGARPGDDFNGRTDWGEILAPHGWSYAGSRNGVDHWTRPGKGEGTSATTGYHKGEQDDDLLIVFSSNAHPFDVCRDDGTKIAYSKFQAYALLNHNGDFTEAAEMLASYGYGGRGIGRHSLRRRRARPIKRRNRGRRR